MFIELININGKHKIRIIAQIPQKVLLKQVSQSKKHFFIKNYTEKQILLL